ncbi:hypothetical protein J7382_09895 [Shimia sp. R11_0]|uniref:Uncharacterized protein n=1 Tax=Shimia marina TaxID=321267 RepID=A0A0P1EK62_9RHOB|nr:MULTISPECIES: hypothetical protein [Shimia]MBO9477847.1 hypothetical protein [Shimia sp. R11_0]CUH50694.1 hypothetical protein SHM7688_00121 [Shimia marina]SFE36614.1 hypothetical protein SAMN04488037_10874 [Shimia marina]
MKAIRSFLKHNAWCRDLCVVIMLMTLAVTLALLVLYTVPFELPAP